jgi:hypothetical protein
MHPNIESVAITPQIKNYLHNTQDVTEGSFGQDDA